MWLKHKHIKNPTVFFLFVFFCFVFLSKKILQEVVLHFVGFVGLVICQKWNWKQFAWNIKPIFWEK